ncbi:MAG: H-NS histone family protein [Rhodobacteraceae bacterium]|nr:H-NS histone family protein [Paracoccaceae bacterium]
MVIKLDKMSRIELIDLRKDVDNAILQADDRDRREALKAAEQAVAKYGFSLSEISGGKGRGKGKRGKAVAKYRNPSNHEQTWSGMGRKPHWIHDALSGGADITDLEI